MTQRLNPYILFSGQARAAATFYQSVLGGELRLMTHGELGGVQDQAYRDWIAHGQLDSPTGLTLMVSDVPPNMGYEVTAGSQISISLSGTDQALRAYFAKLTEGGTVTQPLAKQVWGDEYGDLVDRFGIRWLVNLGSA